MASQPDRERARQLAPHLFPPDPMAQLRVVKIQLELATQRLAKHENTTPAKVLEGLVEATKKIESGEITSKQEGAQAAAPATDKATDDAVNAAAGGAPASDTAQYFGHKEKDVAFPISEKAKSKIAEKNMRFFATKEEAEAAGYKVS